MADDKINEIGPLLTQIGEEIAAILERDPDGAFLSTQVGDNWERGAIFVEEEHGVRWIEPSDELSELLVELWAIDNAGKTEAEGWVYLE